MIQDLCGRVDRYAKRLAEIIAITLLLQATTLSLPATTAIAAEPTYDLVVPKTVNVKTLIIQDRTARQVSEATPFDVDPNGLPTIADGSTLVSLGSSKQLMTIGSTFIEDFAWMRKGAPLFVAQGHLASLGSGGLAVDLKLPSPGMHVRPAGENTAYVYGGLSEPNNHKLYLFARDATIATFLTLPTPIIDVDGDGVTTYVATSRAVLRIAVKMPISSIVQTNDDITSIAFVPNAGLFYATKKYVGYVKGDGLAYEFMRVQSGVLRVRGSSLFVFMRDGPHLIRLDPVEPFEKLQTKLN